MDKRLMYGLIGLAGVAVAAGVVTAVIVAGKKENETVADEDATEATTDEATTAETTTGEETSTEEETTK